MWLDNVFFFLSQCTSRRLGGQHRAPAGVLRRHCCLLFYNAIIINYYNYYLLYNSFHQLPLLLRSPSPLCYLFDLQGFFGEVCECLSFIFLFVSLLSHVFCAIFRSYFSLFLLFLFKISFEVRLVLVCDDPQLLVSLKGREAVQQ